MVYRESGDGRELLVLRRSPQLHGYWHLVAGALEPGETAAEAAARELLEETGLDASPVALGRSYWYPVEQEPLDRQSEFPSGTREILTECFAVEAPPGWSPLLNCEHDEYRWCDRGEAARLLRWP